MDVERLNARAAEIADRETKIWLERTPGSAALYQRAVKVMPAGVASNFQGNDPYPVYLKAGKGSRVWDVDGTEYTDFHGGFGVNVVGHANPKIVEALKKAAEEAVHFAVTTEPTVALAEELCKRFQVDRIRFVNSGTEATMDALRVARAATGKDRVVKMEGSYHGHHDALMFSVVPEADALGLRDKTGGEAADASGSAYTTEPTSKGVPKSMWKDTIIVPFNDLDAVAEVFGEHGDEIGALILEPVMMNVGIIVPKDGYLQGLRDLCDQHDVRADLRRGQVRWHDRLRRRHRALRREAAPRGVGQGHRRGRHDRRLRRRGRHDELGHERRRAAGHLQRQPAVVGGRAGGPHRGADA